MHLIIKQMNCNLRSIAYAEGLDNLKDLVADLLFLIVCCMELQISFIPIAKTITYALDLVSHR